MKDDVLSVKWRLELEKEMVNESEKKKDHERSFMNTSNSLGIGK